MWHRCHRAQEKGRRPKPMPPAVGSVRLYRLRYSKAEIEAARNLFVGCFRPVPPQSIHVSGIVVIRVRVYSIVILARYDPPRHLPDQWRLVCEGVDQRQSSSPLLSFQNALTESPTMGKAVTAAKAAKQYNRALVPLLRANCRGRGRCLAWPRPLPRPSGVPRYSV